MILFLMGIYGCAHVFVYLCARRERHANFRHHSTVEWDMGTGKGYSFRSLYSRTHWVKHFFFFKDFIYLFMRDTQREAETKAEGEAGSMQGAQCGTWSWVSRITPWAAGGAKPLRHRGCPRSWSLRLPVYGANSSWFIFFLQKFKYQSLP